MRIGDRRSELRVLHLFSPGHQRRRIFTSLRGRHLLRQYGFLGRLSRIRVYPSVSGQSAPRRPNQTSVLRRVSRTTCCGRFDDQGPFDGLLLPMHGAATVFGMEDAEGT